jgi:DNA-binding NarL/FixJ family response regulator
MPPSAGMSEILIVDDHAAFRRQARALLEAEGLQVVGEAADGRSAVDAVRALSPQIVLLDIGLPDIDGFQVAALLAREDVPPRVVLISSREAATYGARIGNSSAAGFIQKDDLSARAIDEILHGAP